mmetsp:Transcript_43153/g.111437  ORF Transcript_43153/g.111437 Transcript_43153/m.111437 type:complete len:203 (+) Transcript_43153:1085-1693(+)
MRILLCGGVGRQQGEPAGEPTFAGAPADVRAVRQLRQCRIGYLTAKTIAISPREASTAHIAVGVCAQVIEDQARVGRPLQHPIVERVHVACKVVYRPGGDRAHHLNGSVGGDTGVADVGDLRAIRSITGIHVGEILVGALGVHGHQEVHATVVLRPLRGFRRAQAVPVRAAHSASEEGPHVRHEAPALLAVGLVADCLAGGT